MIGYIILCRCIKMPRKRKCITYRWHIRKARKNRMDAAEIQQYSQETQRDNDLEQHLGNNSMNDQWQDQEILQQPIPYVEQEQADIHHQSWSLVRI